MTRRNFLTTLSTLLALVPAVKAAPKLPDYVIGVDVAALETDRALGCLYTYTTHSSDQVQWTWRSQVFRGAVSND